MSKTPPNSSNATPHDASMVDAPKENPARLDFWVDTPPSSGTVTPIVDGIYWLRMPLPMAGLDHINLWFLKDGDGWAVIDTGIGSRASMEVWDAVFSGTMGGRPVTRVICTHLHPDHTGLAGWISRKYDAPLVMTRGEYFLCRLMASDTGRPAPKHALDFYKRSGFTDSQIELYKQRFGGFGKAISPLPDGYTRMQDGETLTINGRSWHIIVGSGHSPEHACLYNEELKLLFSGDQILPNISSNVSVWPTEPEGNPLQDWIDSCHKLKDAVPKDTLICPAHGLPFKGVQARLGKLIEHHEKALMRLYDYCKTPQRAVDVYPCLFRRSITDGNRILAVGESIAHLNCLIGRKMMTRRINDAGEFTYKSRSPESVARAQHTA